MSHFTTRLLAGQDAAGTWLAPSKRAAYLWCLLALLSLLAVITGAGGLESLVAGLLAGWLGVRRLHVLAEDDYRADLESYDADTHNADVEWWLDTLRYSDIEQERLAARFMIDYWGVRSHLNPLISEADRQAQAERIKAAHSSVQRKAGSRDWREVVGEAAARQRASYTTGGPIAR
jgi:hypothetical protein